MKYGEYYYAGHGLAMVVADIDFETYSEAGYRFDEQSQRWTFPEGGSAQKKGLSLVGVENYTRHPTFEPLVFWYDLKDGAGERCWRNDGSNGCPQDLRQHLESGKLMEAHNVAFERRVWAWLVKHRGFPQWPLAQQRCSMAKARAWALPPSLDKASQVLGTRPKNPDGSKGIKLFCMPRTPTAKNKARRLLPDAAPEDFQRYIVDYCADDIRAEADLSVRVPDLSPIELEHWFVDQTINTRGVAVDVPLLRAMRQILIDAWALYGAECRAATGGIAPSEVSQLLGWAAGRGVRLDALDDDSIEEALGRPDLPADVRRMLECRQAVSSASVKKVLAMLAAVVPETGRIYDLFNFHAARTGRPTGDGPQPTNMPRSGPDVFKCGCGRYHRAVACPWCGVAPQGKPDEWSAAAMEDCVEIVRLGDLKLLQYAYSEPLKAIAGCLRGTFISAPGRDLISSDYTAIEAVVLACLAGEQWRVDLFRNKGKIYEASGAKVGGVSYDELLEYKTRTGKHHPLRQVGKTAELALGYQGWVAAWLAFDSSGSRSEQEIRDIILKWREESPAIVEFWGGQSRRGREEFFGAEGLFILATMTPGTEFRHPNGLVFFNKDDVTYIRLLSGRHIAYHRPRLEHSDRKNSRFAISFDGYNTNPKNGGVGWIRLRTWGGKLVENIVQAVSNDILRHALANLERAGYATVLHVYDEIVAEVPEGFGSVEELERIMTDVPTWAKGWPINADGGWREKSYRKA